MEEFEIKHQPMTCGQEELSVRTYKKIIKGKRGTWYVAIQDNPADNVYFASKEGGKSDGFGGATLTFKLEDGTEDKVQGPWHSNPDALFSDTGYDVRDKCLTFGVIGKDVRFDRYPYKDFIVDVLYKDEDFTIGAFNRIKDKAQELANELGVKIVYYQQSQGGSTRSWCYPEK